MNSKKIFFSTLALGSILLLAGAGCSSNSTPAIPDQTNNLPAPQATQTLPQEQTTNQPSSPVTQPTATQPTSAPKNTSPTFTMAQVATHNSQSSCYTAIRGSVYDLSSWIDQHPGGSEAILRLCGKDGTDAFDGQHGGQRRPESELAGFKIGTLVQ